MALTKVIGAGLGTVSSAELDGAVTINESSASVDFRVESNGNANMLVVDGSADKVGIGTNSPNTILTTSSASEAVGVSAQTATTGSFIAFKDATSTNWYYNHVGAVGDNLKFTTGGSERMRIDSTGAVTKPNQPAFHVQPASLQSNIAIDSNVTVVFDTETYDVGSNFASNTFTAPITGKYLLCFSLYLQAIDTAANYYEASINSSNRDYFPATIDPDFADADFNYFSLTGSSIVDMDANDTAKIVLRQSQGTAQSDINTPSFFSGALIC
tara:strand:+ start:19 stop:828 length:810 start_codon:yes stop_codon:yes gene_type:complete